MQAKGRSIHVFDIASNFKKMEVLQCPKDPKIEMSRTRWITVAPRGQLFMVSGDNVKSALWCYVRGRTVRFSLVNWEKIFIFIGLEDYKRVQEDEVSIFGRGGGSSRIQVSFFFSRREAGNSGKFRRRTRKISATESYVQFGRTVAPKAAQNRAKRGFRLHVKWIFSELWSY